ncbi:MAG: nitroreductase family deazaflavin-dependent oxidoreductase [Anaerolineales bacterium]
MGFINWLERTAVPWFTSLGLSKRAVTLKVLGRKSGQPRKVTIATIKVDGQHYFVSVHGRESDWVRNVRAAGGQAAILSGGRRPVRLVEVPVEERAPILQAYASIGVFGRSAADIARQFGVEPDPTIEQMSAIANQHPVFRIEEPV